MSTDKPNKLKPRLPRGFADRAPAEIAATRRMLETIRKVFERYGFEPVETPAIEYTDALGKFLPDQDRPNEGVFSFQDDDEQWMSLRYDLTAPLARYVAENFDALPKPYRSYRFGYVYRNEKPGPGRFRQFMQFDADTVGSASMAADAEVCMMAADTMERLGIKRGQYLVKVSNRKVLDGILEEIGLVGDQNAVRRLRVLRALDKVDRLGVDGVRALLGSGRTDESSDFTKGAELRDEEIHRLVEFVVSGDPASTRERIESLLRATALGREQVRRRLRKPGARQQLSAGPALGEDQIQQLLRLLTTFPRFHQPGGGVRRPKWKDDLVFDAQFSDGAVKLQIDNQLTIDHLRRFFPHNRTYQTGLDELEQIAKYAEASRYGTGRVLITPSVVRGLEYYTGPVFEVELTFEVQGEDGKPVRFGSVAGGGRYDGLVGRFRGDDVPATGISIGVSRLMAALQHLKKIDTKPEAGPVVVTVFDQDRIADYQKMVASLRNAGIRAELYLGSGKFGAQMKYADRRGSPCAVIQGGDEKAKGEVQIKDLIIGASMSAIKDRDEYLKAKADSQFAVPEDQVVDGVRRVLTRHGVTWE